MIEEIEEERLNKNISLPAYHFIESELLFDQRKNFYDDKIILHHFLHEGRLTNQQITYILERSVKVLKKEKNLLEIITPAHVIGDIHGQFFDLYELLKNFNLQKDTLIFLGDYVDRGVFSLEVYVYLLVLKVNYPDNIFLLRGNHECFSLTSYFTFQEEVKFKHNLEIYNKLGESFYYLPLAAVILKKAFCVHGGISPHLKDLKDIDKIDRFKEIPYEGLMCDLLWSDPAQNFNLSKKKFEFNTKRRVSYVYYFEAVKEFLEKNDLETIIRGHEVEKMGYKLFKCYKTEVPSVYTVFSAPNYCDMYNNLGSTLFFDGNDYELKTYEWVNHPYVSKNYIDVISQTFSFVSEKVAEFYLDLLKYLEEINTTSSTLSKEESTISFTQKSYTEDEIKNEIEFVKQFNKSMIIMREERENSDEIELKEEPLSTNKCKTIKETHSDFEKVKENDLINEEKIDKKIEEKALSLEISPSMINKKSKEIQSVGLEKALDKCKIEIKNDKLNLELKKE
ncbi:Serine-threonine phosphatase catalytic subunit [Tubulinosema ratisbonensis]|uniref:Serine/threonine-protein phosphatase n=1 Tax=Tubulinosema ratisbonensis TaxID=291195 RepID=A0A437ANH4_9MICR|nr:Serine-threonine phosphatase catalytic subunit [Tubulinosema ratisbonensis]